MVGKPKISDEEVLAFVRSGQITGNMKADGATLNYKGDNSGIPYKTRLERLYEAGKLGVVEFAAIKASYKRWGEEHIDTIPDEVILDFVRSGKITGSLNADGATLNYQGDNSGYPLKSRLGRMHECGKLGVVEFAAIKASYQQWGREKIDPIPDEEILAFVRGGQITGNLKKDAKTLNYQGNSPHKTYKARLESLYTAGKLGVVEFEAIKASYKRWGQKQKDTTSNDVILDFIREGRATGNLKADAKTLGYQGDRPDVGYKARLDSLHESGKLGVEELRRTYPAAKWTFDKTPSHSALRAAWEEGMAPEEIAAELKITKGALAKAFQKINKSPKALDETRRVPREEFLAAVRGAPSLPEAAQALGLSEAAVLRRASRYLKMEVLRLEATPNVRWEEAHLPETLPADSPAAVLVMVKNLGEKHMRAPTVLDVAQRLKISRDRAEEHFELLIAQGLLDRGALAQEAEPPSLAV